MYYYFTAIGCSPDGSRSDTDTGKESLHIKGTIQNKIHTINKVHTVQIQTCKVTQGYVKDLLSDYSESEKIGSEPCLPPAFTQISYAAYSSTLKIEAICSPETSIDFQRITQRYLPEDITLHNHNCENLKSYKLNLF
jgi:hypothetical protein